MEHTILLSEEKIFVKLSGQFSFSDTQKFKEVLNLITEADTKPNALVLNFADVGFIDSAGMGMLLLLRKECQARKIPLTLQEVCGQVQKIFHISKFDQLFFIEQ